MGLTERELCPISENAAWFALTVKPQHERTTAAILRNKKLEEFVPMYRSRRRWSDRVKHLDLPLFPGYIFCRFSVEERMRVMSTPSVTSIVGVGRTPTPIADAEIVAIQRAVASGLTVEPSAAYRVGETVRIERGPLAGVEGTLLQIKDSVRLVLGIKLLQRSVEVHISSGDIALPKTPVMAVSCER